MTTVASISGLSTDLKTGLAFLTRLPLRLPHRQFRQRDRAGGWTFPVVGALVGPLARSSIGSPT